MQIGLSQFESPRDIAESVAAHVREATRAAERGCSFVLFPELSLTGYEPAIASRHALDASSPVFDPLGKVSVERSITIAVGAPLRSSRGVEIGLVVFRPDGSRGDYAKQLLHADEEPFFVCGDRCPDVRIGEHTIGLGICYEAMQPSHGEAAVGRGITLFAASVAKHASGVADAHAYFASFAERHGLPVVFVNAVGPNDGFISAGGSAAWNADGTIIDRLGPAAGLLIVDL